MKKILTLLLCLVMAFSFAACTDNSNQSANEGQQEELTYTIDEEATTLTIMGVGHDPVVYTADDLKEMGTHTITYSGRNKKVENARQFETFTGVELNLVLQEAGYDPEDAVLKIICADGYTREYEVEDLYGLYSFQDNESDEYIEVIPMIAITDAYTEYPSPFKLVYGQEDYDTYTNATQDFNTQGWATYIQCIQVTYE